MSEVSPSSFWEIVVNVLHPVYGYRIIPRDSRHLIDMLLLDCDRLSDDGKIAVVVYTNFDFFAGGFVSMKRQLDTQSIGILHILTICAGSTFGQT